MRIDKLECNDSGTLRDSDRQRMFSEQEPPRRAWVLFGLLLAAFGFLALAGCATSQQTSAPQSGTGRGRIDELNLLAMPVAINLDAAPGVDGFAIQVYAVDRNHAKTQPIREGILDVLMFDGLLREFVPDDSQYRRVWNFPANQLKAYAATTAIGTSYRLTLNWGADKPRDDKITLIVRHRLPQGAAVYSSPSSIAIPAK